MSYIKPDKLNDYEFLLQRLLYLRLQLLCNVNLARLLSFSHEKKKKIISEIRKSDASHFESLIDFIKLEDNQKKQLFKLLKNKDTSVTLPPVKIDLLLVLSDFSDKEKEELKKEFKEIVNELLDCLDLDKLQKTVQRKYYGNVQITKGLFMNALYQAAQRMNRLTDNFMYFFNWIQAESSSEAKATAKVVEKISTKKLIRLDETAYDSDRAAHETIGSDDINYKLIEDSEQCLVKAIAFAESISDEEEKLKLSSYEKLINSLVKIRKLYLMKDHESLIAEYENFLKYAYNLIESDIKEALKESNGNVNEAIELINNDPKFQKLKKIQNGLNI